MRLCNRGLTKIVCSSAYNLREVKNIRRLFGALLVLVFAVALIPLGMVQAKKPLVGAMELEYNMFWPGPQAAIPDWVGNITIDGTKYGMTFFCIGSGKAFDDFLKGKVHFFEEIWVIYDWMTFDFETQVLDYGEILLRGYDIGQTNIQNSNYHMNGNVEMAVEEFAAWEGRSVHMSGKIIWFDVGVPLYAPGTFRIN
jgi:hypothetical protein